ncbi:uncharacterized protein ARB_04814 [Trichophyton benhamiae CBS 112371]|uniref:Uncharacterized protein n=1 Tax=Arthroderma benhamiae (strain ATCC MYA-4681 / CBS 112371) TaxID=663331 RepID=D4AKH1_ARTBC|nr:uncharacterized protein ARB_04814 [Trichophyton benhamiae CBS 112371]EFE35880.1 hypothetical protein ARB_04814 [Trichophyton benhamiae CBS 112371]
MSRRRRGEGRASDEGEEEEEEKRTGRSKKEDEQKKKKKKRRRTNAAKGVKQASQRGGSGRAAAETMQPLKARIRNTDTCTFAHASRKKQRRSRRFFGLSMMLQAAVVKVKVEVGAELITSGYDEAWAVGHAHPDRRIEASQRPPRLRAGPGKKAALQQRVGVPLVALISRHTPGMGLSRQLDAYTSPECSLKDGGSQAHLQQHGTTNHTRSPEEPIRSG